MTPIWLWRRWYQTHRHHLCQQKGSPPNQSRRASIYTEIELWVQCFSIPKSFQPILWNHLPHLFYHPISSVPDADSQGQHGSWSTQGCLFEFPGEDSDCQDPEYCANDFGEHMIISFFKDRSWYPRQQVAITSIKGILLKFSGEVIFANRWKDLNNNRILQRLCRMLDATRQAPTISCFNIFNFTVDNEAQFAGDHNSSLFMGMGMCWDCSKPFT